MTCAYPEAADHCMRLLTCNFFSQDACIVVEHILALPDKCGRIFTEYNLTRRCGFNEHRVRRVLGAFCECGLVERLSAPRKCRVLLSLRLRDHIGTPVVRKGYTPFKKITAVLTTEATELLTTREGKMKQKWKMDTLDNMHVLKRIFQRMQSLHEQENKNMIRCSCGKANVDNLIPDASGDCLVCFQCNEPVREQAPMHLDLHDSDCYKAWEIAIGYTYPSMGYLEKKHPNVPARYCQPAQPPEEEKNPEDDMWEELPSNDDIWEEGGSEDDAVEEDWNVFVSGIPKLIYDITEDDQQIMSDEEYTCFTEKLGLFEITTGQLRSTPP